MTTSFGSYAVPILRDLLSALLSFFSKKGERQAEELKKLARDLKKHHAFRCRFHDWYYHIDLDRWGEIYNLNPRLLKYRRWLPKDVGKDFNWAHWATHTLVRYSEIIGTHGYILGHWKIRQIHKRESDSGKGQKRTLSL